MSDTKVRYYSISANGIQLYFESFVLLCYELFFEALSFSQAGIQDFLTDTQRLRRDFQKLIHPSLEVSTIFFRSTNDILPLTNALK